MMKTSSGQWLLGGTLLIFCVPAHAYLDPGTGSALVQALIAAVAAIGVTLKLYWHRIVSFFRRERENEKPDSPEEKGEG